MKKSLVALAVAVAVMPVVASADATIYGRASVSIDYLNNDDGTDRKFLNSIYFANNSSRIGVKGDAELSGGMKAMFQVENDVALGEGGGSWATRESVVGVAGSFGSIKLGTQESPVKMISRKIDLFGDQIGDIRNIPGSRFEQRPSNSGSYTTPNMGGATVTLLSQTMETGSAGTIAAVVNYSMGKDLYVGAGYERHAGGTDKEAGVRVGLNYNMGAISVNAMFNMAMNESGTKDNTRMQYGAGAAYGMGDTKLKAQFYMAGKSDKASATASENGGSILAIGADQKLGEKTKALVAFGMAMSGKNQAVNVAGAGHNSNSGNLTAQTTQNGVADKNQMGFSVGIQHDF